MFIDHAKIFVQAGAGGNGCVSFRREKYVPHGGPNGGDGGDGGSILLEVSASHSTLSAFRFKHHFRAGRGQHGRGSNQAGRSGEDMILRVPPGTVVKDEDFLLADLTGVGTRWMAAKGGRGGRGNSHFATSTHQAPTEAEPGEAGQERWLSLELKLLAEVGLIGYPNVGKSTLISRISAARPKIAEYPFTTLTPNLGVVDLGDYRTFVVADIPGLIEGAHEGHGLGIRFLRHIERTSLLIHLVDPTENEGRDPFHDWQVINSELREYRAALEEKPQIVAVTKMDTHPDPERYRALEQECRRRRIPIHRISSVTGEGLDGLTRSIWDELAPLRNHQAAARGAAQTGGPGTSDSAGR
ncbi:MAG TPA: GTPase ObgE [Candidatus Polarisedimenticolia bacterium]|nr:GTPase ObgE [Candidatus Polarisedimenticolia bacterium]